MVQLQKPRGGTGESGARTTILDRTNDGERRRKRRCELYESLTHTTNPLNPSHSEPEYSPPDFQAMRSNLSPLGKVIAGSIEVGVTTGMSYISSGMLGYFGGGLLQSRNIRELGMKGERATPTPEP